MKLIIKDGVFKISRMTSYTHKIETSAANIIYIHDWPLLKVLPIFTVLHETSSKLWIQMNLRQLVMCSVLLYVAVPWYPDWVGGFFTYSVPKTWTEFVWWIKKWIRLLGRPQHQLDLTTITKYAYISSKATLRYIDATNFTDTSHCV